MVGNEQEEDDDDDEDDDDEDDDEDDTISPRFFVFSILITATGLFLR